MKSYTTLRNLYGSLTNNTEAANLTLGDQLINDAIRRICASFDWPFLQSSASISTVASQQFYNLPYNYDRLVDVTVLQGSTSYSPIEVPSSGMWDRINMNTNVSSNIPQYFFIKGNTIGFFPTPSTTSSNVITVTYRQRVVDLNVADFTTGTVSATNGDETITNSGSNFTSPMAGRWLRITATDTAASSGDGLWYQISSVTNATTLELTRPYNGTTITGGAYTIGQMSALPEAHQDLPVYWAAATYFSSVQPEKQQYPIYKQMYDENFARLVRDYGSKSSNPVMDPGYMGDGIPMNPNLYPTSVG